MGSMARRSWLSVLLVGMALALVASACSSSTPPELTPADAGAVTAMALGQACTRSCTNLDLYVRDMVFTSDTLAGNEQPMAPETRQAIAEAFPDAVFVTTDEAEALFGDEYEVDGGRGVLAFVGPVEQFREDVVGVEVGIVKARLDAQGGIEQFLWNGETWEPTDSATTGITTVTWVS
jgi:hypothetical protein